MIHSHWKKPSNKPVGIHHPPPLRTRCNTHIHMFSSFRNRQISNDSNRSNGNELIGISNWKYKHQLHSTLCEMWSKINDRRARTSQRRIIPGNRFHLTSLGIFGRYVGTAESITRCCNRCIHFLIFIGICREHSFHDSVAIFCRRIVSWCDRNPWWKKSDWTDN